jgi:hypothetical protein
LALALETHLPPAITCHRQRSGVVASDSHSSPAITFA